jgi:diguanylate cyclase (GGDEF)-like protein
MKILIAEDHAPTASHLANLVRPWGYDPLVVADGSAALEALGAPDAPQLAVLDWLMPGRDGAEVCRALRREANRPYAYLILLTGRGGREPLLSGLEAGADEFLVKPVDPDELRVRLNAGRRIVQLQELLLDAQRRLREQATHDGLTGLWNRGAILEILDRELARSARDGRPVCIMLADLDHFKSVNDSHGHLAGDEVLRHAARRMSEVLRPYDAVGRYGGEEFLVVLPGCEARAATTLAKRLRQHVSGHVVPVGEERLKVTVSLGIVVCAGQGVQSSDMLRAADDALYRAKAAGRNRAKLGNGIGWLPFGRTARE